MFQFPAGWGRRIYNRTHYSEGVAFDKMSEQSYIYSVFYSFSVTAEAAYLLKITLTNTSTVKGTPIPIEYFI